MALTPLAEALVQLFEWLPPVPSIEYVDLGDALGRVLAEPVQADVDVPSFDNSAMDGYAVRAADLPGTLTVSQRIPAGAPAEALQPGTAARIFTGAMMPLGADTVVMQEDAQQNGSQVTILGCITQGQHVRYRGADITAHSDVLPVGQLLTPQDLGLAASVGLRQLPVYRRLRVAIMTSGDELVEPGSPLKAWQIYNSNSPQLAAQLALLGVEVVNHGALPDDPEVIGAALERAAAAADCLITCGGVSVGEEDHVRGQIEARGELKLWKLAIKPGKPLAFGQVCGRPVFGLPGNPVSAWATFGLVVKPWLLRAQGAHNAGPRRLTAEAGFAVSKPGTREEYLRVNVTEQGRLRAELCGDQSSGVLSSVSRANALAIVPVGATFEPDDPIEVILMGDFLTAW